MTELSNSFVLLLQALGDWLIVIWFAATAGMMVWIVWRKSELMAVAAVSMSCLTLVVWVFTGTPGVLGGVALMLALGAIYQAIRESKVQP